MAATVDAKSDVGDPNQFEDDQENGLLPAEKKESDLDAPEKKKEGDFDDSDLPEKTRHPLGTSCKLFPLHAWLYFLYIVLAILLPIFGTLLIICGNWSNTGYFSLFAILNYPWPKLKLEDPNYTATSLELLQVSLIIKEIFFPNIKIIPAGLLDLWLLLLVLCPLPRLRHCRLPQAALVLHRHPPYHHYNCAQHCAPPPHAPGPRGRGTDRLGAACARLRTMYSAGGRYGSTIKITTSLIFIPIAT